MRKLNFNVSTMVICTLFFVGILTRLLSPFVPPPPTNRLKDETAPFLRQAMRAIVDWYPMSEEAFAKARREGKLIMLVVGIPSSTLGWMIDNQILADTDAASFVNRHFVCIRIDAQDSPQWLSAYLPLSRTQTGLQRGYQIWFLTPDGRYFGNQADFGTVLPPTWPVLLDQLEKTLDRYADTNRNIDPAVETNLQQVDVQTLLDAPLGGLPDFQPQIQALSALGNPKTGGFPVYGRISIRANAFRFVSLLRDEKALRAWMDPLLREPIVDWMDGGFFIALNSTNGVLRPDYDKNALENAEMMMVLAQASVLFKDDLYRRLALRSFDYFLSQWQTQGYVWASRLSDARADGRSSTVSFSPRTLRENLNGDELDFARNELGLRVETNPAMTVVLRDPRKALASEKFETVMRKLKASRKSEPKYTGERYSDVNSTVFARMIATARMLGDKERLNKILPFWAEIERFRVADDVVRTIGREDPPDAYLGDYLAYSDAALQVYMATGDPSAYENGLRVLLRAKTIFESENSGLWNLMIQAPSQPGPVEVMVPEVLDIYKESCTASVIRLFNNYSRLYRDPAVNLQSERGRQAQQLSQTAFNAMSRFASLSSRIAFFGSGYFCAALSFVDDAHAITVGPDSVKLANELYLSLPTRLVAPAIGDVRPDLQGRKPGIYMVAKDQVVGPLTVAQALEKLNPALRISIP